ncbi:MAG: UDP-N-acetylmuramate--L-alanine ligase [Candidatus Omnitrophota bacterium]|nr:MAG: UDP-N-acetylmuramate--L-alanine ligase [Candidatus Omnitrophota bacterium]
MILKNQHIHFIGIGGIGMSGIAWLCLKQGCKVTGSDVKPTRITQRLEKEGVGVYIGHKKENLGEPSCPAGRPDLVVYSSAITFQNPELRTAVYSGIPTWRRGEFLSELMKGKTGIAVSGSHGKTTTSSLITTLLYELGYEPSGMLGAIVDKFNGSALLGKGKYFVTEADESDGSFLSLSPAYAVITNIDAEHLDFYSDMDQIMQAYLEFANNVSANGALICCGDDENIRKIIPNVKRKVLTYGFHPSNILGADKAKFNAARSEFICSYKTRRLGKVKLNLSGEHNILNAMATILLGLDIGIKFDDIKNAIEKYRGAERRFQIKADIDDILIIDDYAHHPTEIKATLKACLCFGKRKVIAVFQPHRYTRTKFLKKEFARSFADVDFLILTDIYPASEQPIYGVTTKNIYDEIIKLRKKNVTYLPKEDICRHLLKIVRSGDLVIIMGAGDINRLADELVEKLKSL